jgi:hypothetical protein
MRTDAAPDKLTRDQIRDRIQNLVTHEGWEWRNTVEPWGTLPDATTAEAWLSRFVDTYHATFVVKHKEGWLIAQGEG